MQFITNLSRAIREIWQGSGTISIRSIAIITFTLYVAFTIVVNNNLFLLIAQFKGTEDFHNKESYLYFLENQNINEINILIPTVCTLLLLIQPLRQIKSNVVNRLLPVTPTVRIIALLITITLVTLISVSLVYLLDQCIIYYIRKTYLPETISLQESFGDLYKNIPNDRVLAPDFVYSKLHLLALAGITFVSLVANILFSIISLLFQRYSVIKGLVLIIAVVAVSALLHYKIQDSLLPHTVMPTNVNLWSRSLYPYLLWFSLVFGLFYLLKEREE